MRRMIVAALSLSFAAVFLAGAAQAKDGSLTKRWLGHSPAVMKSTDSLLIAAAGRSAPKSAGEEEPTNKETTKKKPTAKTKKKPAAKKRVAKDKTKTFKGTKGVDRLSGRIGKKDAFHFDYYPDFLDPSVTDPSPGTTTLDDGDRIANYEFGEHIVINGIKMVSELGERFKHVKIVYDAKKNETRIEIDMGGPKTGSRADGKVDRTIVLTGDKRGTLKVDAAPCCVGNLTEIWIEKPEKPKTAKENTKTKKKAEKKKPVKRSSAATHRRVKKPVHYNRYPNDSGDNTGGGD